MTVQLPGGNEESSICPPVMRHSLLGCAVQFRVRNGLPSAVRRLTVATAPAALRSGTSIRRPHAGGRFTGTTAPGAWAQRLTVAAPAAETINSQLPAGTLDSRTRPFSPVV